VTTRTTCECLNHLHHPKTLHETRDAALAWMTHKASWGLRLEVYPCPTADGFHVRTARSPHLGGAR